MADPQWTGHSLFDKRQEREGGKESSSNVVFGDAS